MTHESMDFDGDLVEIPVRIEGQDYTLREASGDAACKYRNALIHGTVLGPNGKPQKLRNVADTEPLLVSLCLFDANGKNVPPERVRIWPSRIQAKLFNKAKEISDLDQQEETPLRKALVTALQQDDAPVSLRELQEWSATLPEEEELKPFVDLVKPTPEEAAKNGQEISTDGSD